METPLPSNQDLEAYSEAVPWQRIEESKRAFNKRMRALARSTSPDELPLEDLSDAAGFPISAYYESSDRGNVLLGHINGRAQIMASTVSQHYRRGKTLLESFVPYNFNPAVNHTNLHETDDALTRMRALGAELELGLYHPDGSPPTEDEMQVFIATYRKNAHVLGITPTVDREACQYQVEVHIAPGVGYNRTRQSLDGIMSSLVAASRETGLCTAMLSAYPILSDFHLTPDPKVETAVAVMTAVNNHFPEYPRRLAEVVARYSLPPSTNVVESFRLQGCHIHLDLAGRSEALGLLTFYTMLRSASAVANAAVLKGGPFVNGTCDAELLCTREYLRSATITGRYIEMPLSPHLIPGDLDKYASLLYNERANSVVRALLYDDSLGEPVSVMHNPLGRLRPDLGTNKRICTLESTGMPVNISASRQAAVLTDFELTHALIEHHFRRHGCNLEPLYADKTLWEIIGPLGTESYIEHQQRSDREGSDMLIRTPSGREMTLPEFYDLKRRYMHRHLGDIIPVTPRDIDDVYQSLMRMLDPPGGRQAETVEQYIADPMLRSTGNWGRILRSAFIEEGGTPGSHNPEAVLRVANRVHQALFQRYG